MYRRNIWLVAATSLIVVAGLGCRDHRQLSYLGTPHGKLKAYLSEMMSFYFHDLHRKRYQAKLLTTAHNIDFGSMFLLACTSDSNPEVNF
jgi:hypothetical protein